MLLLCSIFTLLNGVVASYGHLKCNALETRFCPELDTFLNYRKCEGFTVGINYPHTEQNREELGMMMDISGTELRTLPIESTNITCILNNVVFLNLSDNQLTSVDNINCSDPDVKVLDLSRNSIRLIGRTSFSRMTKITNLYLTGNGINLIEPYSFGVLKNLTHMDISDNGILGIGVDTFSGMTNLRYISLAKNNIGFITVGAFDSLIRLKTIHLSYNLISELDILSFTGAEALQYLNLRNNRIKVADFKFLSTFENLELFDISENQFQGLESAAFSKTNVSNIVLNHTSSLRYIFAEAFESCPLLKTVDLSYNPNLFYIHGCAFQGIPSTFRSLDLTGSAIEYLNLKFLNNQTRIVLNKTNIRCDCVNKFILRRSQNNETIDSDCSFVSKESNDCKPKIVSDIKHNYILSVGEKYSIDCFAVGIPWPDTRWVKVEHVGSQPLYELITTSHRLDIHVTAVTQGGTYGCIARLADKEVLKLFNLLIRGIDIGVFVVARAATSIIISWNKTHDEGHHVVLHREYEVTLNYHVHRLNEYWKVFKLSDLKPETPYEICIGSALDINDRNCVKSSTTLSDVTAGIHTDFGVVLILVLSALILGACFVTVICKCIKKLSRGYKGIYMINAFSREHSGDLTEPVLTYENRYTDSDILEEEDKTEF